MTTSSRPIIAAQKKGFHIGLWVLQVLVGGAFGMSGLFKFLTPIPELHANIPWANALPDEMLRFIGAAEFMGALGLLLPSLLRIAPQLTPLAAAGLAVIMSLAIPFHLMRNEISLIVPNILMGGLAAFIAWGRFKKSPIAPK